MFLKFQADARLAENVKLVTITESQKNVPKQRVITKEERERKEAILRQYAEVSDGEYPLKFKIFYYGLAMQGM